MTSTTYGGNLKAQTTADGGRRRAICSAICARKWQGVESHLLTLQKQQIKQSGAYGISWQEEANLPCRKSFLFGKRFSRALRLSICFTALKTRKPGEGVIDMAFTEMEIALFILGIGVGIALHRLVMALVLECDPDTKCAYCEWTRKKKCRHNKWRH